MKTTLRFMMIAMAHIALLLGAYATHLFGLALILPYSIVVFIWLAATSALAAWGYFSVSKALRLPVWGKYCLSAMMLAGSLYTGIFLALNLFGT